MGTDPDPETLCCMCCILLVIPKYQETDEVQEADNLKCDAPLSEFCINVCKSDLVVL